MATTTKTVTDILNEYGAKVEAELTDNLEFDGKLATGKLKDSVRYRVVILGKQYVFEIFMEEYWKYVDKGRRAGKPPPQKAILGWLTAKRIGSFDLGKRKTNTGKGIKGNESVGKKSIMSTVLQQQKALAFLIARKIGKHGTKGSGFYTNTFKSGHAGDIEPLEQELSELLERDVKVMIEEVKQEITKT